MFLRSAAARRFYSTAATGATKPRVLITGCSGQIGTELVETLRTRYGRNNVIASDVKTPTVDMLNDGPFAFVDVCDGNRLNDLVQREGVTLLIHNAAFLSAMSERLPHLALRLNCEGLHNVLDVAHRNKCRLFVPSSIAAFGTTTPLDNTPDFTIQRPESIYGIGKLYAELMGEYYYKKKGLDFRSLRYPGVISYKTLPGGGTTDYAVDMFFYALRGEHYECYLTPDVLLPMMYMPDCIKATVDILEAPSDSLGSQRAYNVTAFSFSPAQLAKAIQRYIPGFTVSYKPDTIRQPLAESWPNQLDDSLARQKWKWHNDYDLDAMVKDMIVNIKKQMVAQGQQVKAEIKGL